jgi:predicted Zn-dependent protease
MKEKSRLHMRWIISVGVVTLFALELYPFTPRAFGLSIEEERVLGEKFVAEVRSHFELIDDDFAVRYINGLGRQLTANLETRPFPFHFYIIRDNTVNAFAAPGGHIFVFSGLIELTDNLDELASVICHEIGHVSARHLSERLEQGKKIGLATLAGILAGALIGGPVAEALMAGSMAAGIQTQLHYSRNDERQADQLGSQYMASLGLDPSAAITILKKMERESWLGTDKVPAYLLTHPSGPERMANLDSLVSHLTHQPPNRALDPYRMRFPYFKTLIRAKQLDFQTAETLFHRELAKTPGAPLPHFGLGIVYKDQSDYEKAAYHLKKALEGEPHFVPLLRDLGEVYQLMGKDNKAVAMFQKALELDEADKPTLFLLALSYENLGQHQEAIDILERLAALRPVKREVYYHLGISYGRQDRLGLAHYNFGVYFKSLHQPNKAAFHFRKALELSQNDPHLKKKIHEAMEQKPS